MDWVLIARCASMCSYPGCHSRSSYGILVLNQSSIGFKKSRCSQHSEEHMLHPTYWNKYKWPVTKADIDQYGHLSKSERMTLLKRKYNNI